MFNFTITTDNVAEAQTIINAINGAVVDIAPTVVATDTVEDTPTTETVEITPNQVQEAIDNLVSMDADELVKKFGEGNDKPYRVIKNIGLDGIVKAFDATGDEYDTETTLEEITKAIQIIIKDVSVGGLSHDNMERLFDVRTSKKLFKEYELDQIVRILESEDYI